jgi:Flp pilus assembly protein TadG
MRNCNFSAIPSPENLPGEMGWTGMIRRLIAYRRRCATEVARFRSAERGATAVEFALVAPAFIAVLVAVLQTCVYLFAQMVIQNAAVQAGRYFMTGQAQNNNWTASTIVTKVCPTALFTCSNMFIVVQNYSSFAAASTSAPSMYTSGVANTQSSYAYDAGSSGDVMVVQLIYAWPVVTAPFGFNLSNLPNNAAELMGVSAFKVEPYQTN